MIDNIIEKLERIIQGLARVKSEGKILGRPIGSKNTNYKLDGCEDLIKDWLSEGKTKTYICQRLKVHRSSLYHFIKNYLNKENLEEELNKLNTHD